MKQFINVKRVFTVLIILLLLISCRSKLIIDHYLTKIYQMLIMIVRFGPLKMAYLLPQPINLFGQRCSMKILSWI